MSVLKLPACKTHWRYQKTAVGIDHGFTYVRTLFEAPQKLLRTAESTFSHACEFQSDAVRGEYPIRRTKVTRFWLFAAPQKRSRRTRTLKKCSAFKLGACPLGFLGASKIVCGASTTDTSDRHVGLIPYLFCTCERSKPVDRSTRYRLCSLKNGGHVFWVVAYRLET